MRLFRLLPVLVAPWLAISCAPSVPRAVAPTDARPAPAPTERVRRYRIVASESSITAVATASLGRYTFTIPRVVGHIDWVPRQPARSQFEIVADMRSLVGTVGVVTRIVRRDFLHVERFPEASFASSSLRQTQSGRGVVTGTLKLHGVSRALEVPGRYRFVGRRVHIESEFVIDRREFGIESDGWVDSLVQNDVVVRLSLVGTATE